MQALLQATLERSSMPHALKMEAAIAYARNHGLHALLVARGSDVLAQEVGDGFQVDTPHALYSGTKSFWGVAAIYACADGLLELDEPLAETIDLWRDDPWKRRITARMLLSLTAGFGFGGLGASVPTYDRALGMPLKNEPGSGFKYGGIPFQAFGAFFARKLFATGLTPNEYLRERVLDPAGVRIGSWRQLSDGTQPLPTGASLSAVNWLTYGRFVLRERVALKSCFEGSAANVRYGLGWWLGARGAPSDLVYASGSAGQGLYLVPSLDLAIVHFAKSSSYRHDAFLKRLFG
jgi:CubicO group peptidase (beta-lactamase class C family)